MVPLINSLKLYLFWLIISLFLFADLKGDVFTAAGDSSFISELEKKHKCVVEVRTKGWINTLCFVWAFYVICLVQFRNWLLPWHVRFARK